jgi:hypothetical protein
MGREDGTSRAGSRWLRTIAHLAIVVVFVLSALGYAPLGDHAMQPVKPVVQVPKLAAVQGDCNAEAGERLPSADRATSVMRPCDMPQSGRTSEKGAAR